MAQSEIIHGLHLSGTPQGTDGILKLGPSEEDLIKRLLTKVQVESWQKE